MLADDVSQREEQRRLRSVTGGNAVEFRLTGGQPGQAFLGRGIAFVGNVVGTARKAVDGLDRRIAPPAQVAKLVDAAGLGPAAARCGGSSPFLGTS